MSNLWTDDRIDLLRKLRAKGLSFSICAYELNKQTGSNFKRNALIGKAARIGIGKDKSKGTPTDIEPQKPKQPKVRKQRSYHVIKPYPHVVLPPPDATLDEIEAIPAPKDFLAVRLLDLKPSQCRYPRGGNDAEPILFCGQPRMTTSSYCQDCHTRCHTRPRAVGEDEHQRRSNAAKRIWRERRNRAA